MKIGMIAMSGVRACDPELMRLGFSLPGFIERGKTIASLPSLGLLTLAGMTPPIHRIEYLEVRDLPADNYVRARDYDLVAISSFTAQIEEAYELSRLYRANGATVVMGGLHVSMLPEEAAQHCDCVVIGEGELSWPSIVRDFERGELKRFYGSLDAQFDLSQAPLPSFEILDLEKYNRLTIQTSRGCPFRCEFCASSILLTKKYKQKPKEKVLDEVRKLKQFWKDPFVEFADDNSFVDKRYWKELLPSLQKQEIRWFAETDISVADDEALLDLMRESGCAAVLIGLESPVRDGLNGLEMKNNWKWKKLTGYRSAIAKIQSRGIRVNGCFVLGLDGHRPSVFDDVFDFVKESELFDVQITVQTAFPGTPLYKRLKSEGRIIRDRDWRACTLFDVNFHPTNMSAGDLADGFRELAAKLYSAEFTSWRRDRFKERYRRNFAPSLGG
jgi:radical SAM superfamily enzyme YgiQ (UPF0313 family)